MKILLVGEFSRLHNSLKAGLVALGHDVTLVSAGDDFKKFPSDLSFAATTVNGSGLLRSAEKLVRKLTGIRLSSLEKERRFRNLLPSLTGYDIVQFINSDALEARPSAEPELHRRLISQNGKAFLLVCGDETPIVDHWLSDPDCFSPLTPLHENPENAPYFRYTLNYASNGRRRVFDDLRSQVSGLIASDLDYHLPLAAMGIAHRFIPNPVIVPEKPQDRPNGPIKIFHGTNKYSSVKKGSRFFSDALSEIENRYGSAVQIVKADSLPYAGYVRLRDTAHIVLDQIYALDQGYNALEAMANGQVVFTGAGAAFRRHYRLEEEVAIETRPDVGYLVERLVALIENPDTIDALGQRARAFILREHGHIGIAQRYLDAWNAG